MGKLRKKRFFLFLLNSFFLYFRNYSLLDYFEARIHFSFPHMTLTVNLLSKDLFLFFILLMHFRRCPVSHVNQSRAVSTFEDWLSHGEA